MKQKTVKSVVDAPDWIETNPHHWASAEEPGFFVIGGFDYKLRIPDHVYAKMDKMIMVGDRLDARMYRATPYGKRILTQHRNKALDTIAEK